MKSGVNASAHWLPKGDWCKLLDHLNDQFPDIHRSIWMSRLERGEVVDENGEPFLVSSPYKAHQRIYYYRELENEPEVPFQEKIIYQDENIVVADKPHFLAVIPSGQYLHQTLLVRLKKKLNLEQLSPIHRIDRETAGLVVFSKNAQQRGAYQRLFANKQVTKTYLAIAPFKEELQGPINFQCKIVPSEPFFLMKKNQGLANSETIIQIQKRMGVNALYKLMPITGKKHQLRLHMAELGVPIINDPFYPKLMEWEDKNFKNPLKLLAKSIEFIDPWSNKQFSFESQLSLTLG